jgi:D-alanine-D-alanine ligase
MMPETKRNLGVIFGGRSGEHAVSLMSARFVLSVIPQDKYNITQIGITREGVWLTGEAVLDAMLADAYDGLTPATMLPDPTLPGLRAVNPRDAGGEALALLADLDVAFPVLHGSFGEDGTLQGLFDMAGMAYVGAGVLGSVVGMDKGVFFDLMRANAIPVVETIVILRSEMQEDIEAAIEKAEQAGSYPLFVKPANLGSSVGVSKVNSRADLVEGLIEASQYDRRVVVQPGLNIREIEVGVLGNDRPQASVCGEVIPGEEFYSYNAKYHDETSQTIIPAEIPQATSDRIRDYAVRAFQACDLAGLARVDFFLEKDSNDVYLNELNTMPGFTEISMYPMLWEASGVSNTELVDRLISLGLERYAEQQASVYTFERRV